MFISSCLLLLISTLVCSSVEAQDAASEDVLSKVKLQNIIESIEGKLMEKFAANLNGQDPEKFKEELMKLLRDFKKKQREDFGHSVGGIRLRADAADLTSQGQVVEKLEKVKQDLMTMLKDLKKKQPGGLGNVEENIMHVNAANLNGRGQDVDKFEKFKEDLIRLLKDLKKKQPSEELEHAVTLNPIEENHLKSAGANLRGRDRGKVDQLQADALKLLKEVKKKKPEEHENAVYLRNLLAGEEQGEVDKLKSEALKFLKDVKKKKPEEINLEQISYLGDRKTRHIIVRSSDQDETLVIPGDDHLSDLGIHLIDSGELLTQPLLDERNPNWESKPDASEFRTIFATAFELNDASSSFAQGILSTRNREDVTEQMEKKYQNVFHRSPTTIEQMVVREILNQRALRQHSTMVYMPSWALMTISGTAGLILLAFGLAMGILLGFALNLNRRRDVNDLISEDAESTESSVRSTGGVDDEQENETKSLPDSSKLADAEGHDVEDFEIPIKLAKDMYNQSDPFLFFRDKWEPPEEK